MKFLEKFNDQMDKMEGVGTSSLPPRYWYSTSNYVLNRVISGSFTKGIPQGRITGLAGPSGSGKSFVSGNIAREAQKRGAHILVIDSENALDDGFMTGIGVDVENNYNYVDVKTIPQVTKVVSAFLRGYKDEYPDDHNAPQVLIIIDSLDMLMTETEELHYKSGTSKGDQGQRNKQLKAMLRTFVQDIKHLNVSMIVTSQVYRNQDLTNGEGTWVVSEAVKYSLSQIILLTKLKLRDEKKKTIVHGIRMKCEGYKTRFTQTFQNVEIHVPYATGIDPLSGMVEVATSLGIVEQKGSWYYIGETKFRGSEIGDYIDDILVKAETMTDKYIQIITDDDESDEGAIVSAVKKRKEKAGFDDVDEAE